jgi:hypothetical protein
MRRRAKWFLIVAVLVIVGVVAAGALMAPDIADARDRVDERWRLLREPLAERYEALAAVAAAMHTAGAGDRAVTIDLDATLARWEKLALIGPTRADTAKEATTANELEALARRLEANINRSDRLEADQALGAAKQAFDLTYSEDFVPNIDAYNRAVRGYERERSGALHRLVAGVLGYDARPLLVIGA